jgi:bifunctional DNase/RNase
MIEATINSLGLDADTDQPVIVLKSSEDGRMLPIWIGHPEAGAILLEVQGFQPPRPLTHDLLRNTIMALGFMVERVEITGLHEGTFIGNIVLFDGTNTVEIDARPSDSLALAVRVRCPIFVADEVMAEAGREPRPGDNEEEQTEEALEEFRDFLEHVNPEDFGDATS